MDDILTLYKEDRKDEFRKHCTRYGEMFFDFSNESDIGYHRTCRFNIDGVKASFEMLNGVVKKIMVVK